MNKSYKPPLKCFIYIHVTKHAAACSNDWDFILQWFI